MVKFKNVEFFYENSKKACLKNLNLHIQEGECVVLAGKSGEGKTTVTRLLNGLIPNYIGGKLNGEIRINGNNHLTMSIADISAYTGSVFQDPRSQFFCTDVLSELVFTCENFGIPKEEIESRIAKIIPVLKIEGLLNKKIFNLSSGERQKLAIASVLIQKPKIILLDEPSANLDYEAIKNLEKILYQLKANGYTLIISEHRLYYLNKLFDKIYYVKSGMIEEEFCRESIQMLNNSDFEKRGLRKFNLEFEKKYQEEYIQGNQKKKVKVEINNLEFWFNKNNRLLDNISLKLYQGEVIALLGENGAGKTTFAKLLAGLHKEKRGDIYFDNKKIKSRDRVKEVSLVLQDTDYQLFSESVLSEFFLGKVNENISKERVEQILSEFDLEGLKEKHPLTLSGGQKQRITIALSIVKGSSVVIMDEPTSGLDYINMQKVTAVVNSLKQQGKTVIIITHDYEFLINSCDRILNLSQGKIKDDFYIDDGNMEKLEYLYHLKKQ